MTDSTYLLPNDVVKLFKDQTDVPLLLFHLNVQSVRNKFDEFSIILDSFKFSFDIIMLTETWYNQSDGVDQLEKYAVFNLNRSNKVGGGVYMYVKKGFEYNIVSDFTATTNDLQHDKFVFSVVYRPPFGNVATFHEFFENFLQVVGENKSCLYLDGGFNIDMLTSSKYQLDLLSLYQSYGLSNVISLPSRLAPLRDTLLDLFITNVPTTEILAGATGVTISDHLPIFVFSNVNFYSKN